MSDSGRTIGDCKHGATQEWCVTCLRECLSRCRYLLVNVAWAGVSHPDNYLIGADDRTAALKAIDALLGGQ